MDDKEYLELISQKDENALILIMDRYMNYICSIIYRILNGRMTKEDMEEVAADSFYELWIQASHIKLKNNTLTGYIGAIARTKAINKLREATNDTISYEREDIIINEDIYEIILAKEHSKEIRNAILKLKPVEIEVFEKYYFNNMLITEIAQDMKRPVNSIKSILRRGKAKMKEELQNVR